MSDNDPQTEIDEAKRENDEDLGELDDQADDLEERLAENEAISEDVEVPDPDEGDALSI
jgi:hypothetical protein